MPCVCAAQARAYRLRHDRPLPRRVVPFYGLGATPMAMPADTDSLSDAEILHLLRTQAPGIPPSLDHPPLPPDTLTPPPWAACAPTTHLGRWIALAGGLGM